LVTSYQIKQAKVGDALFPRVLAHTVVIGPEAGGGNVFIGNAVLRHYRVTFDFKHSTLWLEK
jgi:hypothetical protein